MLTFSSQTLSLGNWIREARGSNLPPPPPSLKMLPSKGRVFLLRADPASEGLAVQKLQILSPLPPPPHTHTVRMAENKETGGGGVERYNNNNNNDNKNRWIYTHRNQQEKRCQFTSINSQSALASH